MIFLKENFNFGQFHEKADVLASILTCFQLQLSLAASSCDEIYNKAKASVMRTHAGFHISRFYNKVLHGSSFTFNQIAGDPIKENSDSIHHKGIAIEYASDGTIKALNDGKKMPIVLASIPCKQSHINRLQQAFNQAHNDSVEIATFNETWECDAAGLSQLLKNNKKLWQYHYPTPDFSSPSLVDLIRVVRDIKNRDALMIIHCKAGRGRSATGIGAYVATVIHEAKEVPNVESIEKYLRSCRPQVSMNREQKEMLERFIAALKDAGSFERLYAKNRGAVDERDKEVAKMRVRQVK